MVRWINFHLFLNIKLLTTKEKKLKNINKLKEGMVFKNYKELCDFLSEPVKSGKSKVAQLSMWESYFEFEKEKYQIKILSIYDKPKGKMSRYGFINDIEELILDLVVQDKNSENLFLSKNQLFKLLRMTNENYNFSRYHIPKLSIFTKISENEIHEFYDLSKSALTRSVENALRKLENKSLIKWSSALTVCRIKPQCVSNESGIKVNRTVIGKNDYDENLYKYDTEISINQVHTEASSKEIKAILSAERQVMDELNCKDKQEVIKLGLWSTYIEKVKNIIFESHNIVFYYDSYKITCNDDYVYNVWTDLKELSLDEETKCLKHENLNVAVQQKLILNTIKRCKRQIASNQNHNSKYDYRLSSSYIDNTMILIDYLISILATDIKEDLKAIKINQ